MAFTFQVDKTHITLQRFGDAQFLIKPTVPFGCYNKDNDCKMAIEMIVPNSDNSCQGRITSAHYCHVDIQKTDWNEWKNVSIAWLDSGKYKLTTSETTFYLRFQTSLAFHHPQWDHYQLEFMVIFRIGFGHNHH